MCHILQAWYVLAFRRCLDLNFTRQVIVLRKTRHRLVLRDALPILISHSGVGSLGDALKSRARSLLAIQAISNLVFLCDLLQLLLWLVGLDLLLLLLRLIK